MSLAWPYRSGDDLYTCMKSIVTFEYRFLYLLSMSSLMLDFLVYFVHSMTLNSIYCIHDLPASIGGQGC